MAFGEVGDQQYSDDDLLALALTGQPRRRDPNDVGGAIGAPPSYASATGRMGPAPSAAGPVGAVTPAAANVQAAGALPKPNYPAAPEVDPRYEAVVKKQAEAEKGVDPNDPRYKMSLGMRLLSGLAGAGIDFGNIYAGGHGGNGLETAMGLVNEKHDEAATRLKAEGTAAGTEAEGIRAKYQMALGKYNAQMKEIEDQNQERRTDAMIKREDNTAARYEEATRATNRRNDIADARENETERHNRETEKTANTRNARLESGAETPAEKRRNDQTASAYEETRTLERQKADRAYEKEMAEAVGDQAKKAAATERDMKYAEADTHYKAELAKIGRTPKATGAASDTGTQKTEAGSTTSQVSGKGGADKKAADGGRVVVQDSKGKKFTVPQSQLQQAEAKGYKRVTQ